MALPINIQPGATGHAAMHNATNQKVNELEAVVVGLEPGVEGPRGPEGLRGPEGPAGKDAVDPHVRVLVGDEVRPAVSIAFWHGGTTRPLNMIEGDVWITAAVVVPEDPEEPEEPEEPTDPGTPASYLSVFGTASPGATSEAHSDGGGSLVVGDRFYSTKAIRVRGARLWNPPTADGTFLTRPVVFNAYGEDWVSEGLMTTVPAGSPTATKTFTGQRVAGTWTEVLFDTPILINPVASAANGADTITITVNMEGTHYVTTSLATSNEDAVRSTMDSGTYLAEMTFRRAVANVSIQPFAYYGVDILFEVV